LSSVPFSPVISRAVCGSSNVKSLAFKASSFANTNFCVACSYLKCEYGSDCPEQCSLKWFVKLLEILVRERQRHAELSDARQHVGEVEATKSLELVDHDVEKAIDPLGEVQPYRTTRSGERPAVGLSPIPNSPCGRFAIEPCLFARNRIDIEAAFWLT